MSSLIIPFIKGDFLIGSPRASLAKHQRIYTNRTLNLSNIKLIGFDMDYTLAPYKKESFESLAFHETLKKFIEHGYPEELSLLKYKPDFLIRGLLVDRERGNILKVDGHKYVKDAYHGYRRLSKEERYELYNKQSYKAENFLSVDSFFALSEVQLFVEIVDFMSKNPSVLQKSFQEVYADIRIFIDLCHQDGSIKKKILANPEKYILKDKSLPITLVRLLDAGKFLFLLTNSHYDYTKEVMDFLLSGAHEEFVDWKDYWDLIIVGAGKPGFFYGNQTFFEVMEENNLLKIHSGPLIARKVYHGGNAKLFEKLTGYKGDEILYVGDHIYGDIIQSKGALNWRTMLIVEELEDELPKLEKIKKDLGDIYKKLEEKEDLDEVLQKLRSMIAAAERHHKKALQRQDKQRAKALNLEIEIKKESLLALLDGLNNLEREIRVLIKKKDSAIHSVWGPLMKVGLERSRFANQISNYACIYTAKVSNLRFYSPFKKFISVNENLPHDYVID